MNNFFSLSDRKHESQKLKQNQIQGLFSHLSRETDAILGSWESLITPVANLK
jgi:hypothetical protein